MFSLASTQGILEKKALENYAKKNYEKYLRVLSDIKDTKIKELKEQGHIYKRKNRKECQYVNVMDDYLYEESKKLYGLKLFLEEFTNIKEKEAIEVKLWDQYLMFAYIFGIADKVAKQFKNLYPEIVSEMQNTYSNLDFDTILYINRISYSSVSSASSARNQARSYSSGGGGGGSFGGGGGGSR